MNLVVDSSFKDLLGKIHVCLTDFGVTLFQYMTANRSYFVHEGLSFIRVLKQ